MKLTEYRELISEIDRVLRATKERPLVQIYKAFLDAFPGQVPEFDRAIAAYNEVKEAPEKKLAIILLRKMFPRHQDQSDESPSKTNQNSKYGTRRDPFAIIRPKQTAKSWKEKYYDPTIVFESPEAMGDVHLCNLMDEEAYRQFKSTGNMLHVLEAFFRRIDLLVFGEMEDDQEIKIQAWMATALANGFKQYYSRKIVHKEENITLDAVFGIEGKKKLEAFDPYTIDTHTLVEKTREVQWHFNLKFTPAIRFTRKMLEAKYIARGDGHNTHRFTHAEISTICTEEARKTYPSYMAWCEDKGLTFLAGKRVRDSFLDVIEAISPDLKKELEAEISNPQKHLFTSNL